MRLSHSDTDPGVGRPSNQDVLFVDDRLGAYIVADGVGGQAGGKEAARAAVDAAVAFLRAAIPRSAGRQLEALARMAVENANTAVYQMAARSQNLEHARTTITVLLLSGSRMAVAHVGDSRLTCFDAGIAYSLTHAHTIAAELLRMGILNPQQAARHPGRHTLTRSLGKEMIVKVDVRSGDVAPGSTFVLASDGLDPAMQSREFGHLAEKEALMRTPAALIELAKARGSEDNLSVVVVRCFEDDEDERAPPWGSQRPGRHSSRSTGGLWASLVRGRRFFSRRPAPF